MLILSFWNLTYASKKFNQYTCIFGTSSPSNRFWIFSGKKKFCSCLLILRKVFNSLMMKYAALIFSPLVAQNRPQWETFLELSPQPVPDRKTDFIWSIKSWSLFLKWNHWSIRKLIVAAHRIQRKRSVLDCAGIAVAKWVRTDWWQTAITVYPMNWSLS